MKKFAFLFIFCCSALLSAASMVTVIGDPGKLQLAQYKLLVKSFNPRKALSRAEALRICEAMDNSNAVLCIGDCDTEEFVFQDVSVRKALAGLMKRGGCFYLSYNNWSWCRKAPKSLWSAMKEIGVLLPPNYCAFPGNAKRLEGKFSPEYPWALIPNKTFEIMGSGHPGKMVDKNWKKFIVSKDGKFTLALIRTDVLGKGCVIASYVARFHQRDVSPFIENLLTRFYGPRNVGVKSRRSAQSKAAVPAGTYVNLASPVTLTLNLCSGKAPECPTTVKVSADKQALKLRFFCETPEPGKLKKRITARDGAIWTDDCAELFIADCLKSNATVYQFILNVNNALFDSRAKAVLWNCAGIQSSAKATPKGYEAEFIIPFASIGIKPVPGNYFRMNLCREARAGVKKSSCELQSFTPTSCFSATDSMAYFGFSATPPAVKSAGSADPNSGARLYSVSPFTRIYADFEPKAGTPEVTKIQITAPRNDREAATMVLYNPTDWNLRYRVEPDWTLRKSNIPWQKLLSVKEVLPFRGINKQVWYEIISGLNESRIVQVPGSDLSVLYIEAFTKLKPGKYAWGFTLVPVNADVPKRRVEVEVEVLNLTLPEKLPCTFYWYGPYVADQRYYVANPDFTRGQWEHYLNFFHSYHASCIHVADPFNKGVKVTKGKAWVSDKKSDFLFNEKELSAKGFRWSYHYGVWAVLQDRLKRNGLPNTLKDPGTRKLFEEAVARWKKFLEEEKIDFNSFSVPVWDEPRTADLYEVITASAILRKAGFRVNQTLANWTVLNDVKALKDSVDYWIPLEYLVTGSSKDSAEILKIIRSHGKGFAPYMCSVGGTTEDYQSYFRLRGMQEFLIGANGVCLWASNSWRGNDYDSRDDVKMRGMFLFHHGDRGPVPTIRLEALREGIEEFYYLNLAVKSSDPAAKKLAAPETLKKLMLRSDPAELAKWHTDLLKALNK